MEDKFVYCIENRYTKEGRIFTKDQMYKVLENTPDTLLIKDDYGKQRNIITQPLSLFFTKPTSKEEISALLYTYGTITKTMNNEKRSTYTKGCYIGINSDSQLVLTTTNKNISAILAPIAFLLDMWGEALIVELKNNSFYIYPEENYTWKKLEVIIKVKILRELLS